MKKICWGLTLYLLAIVSIEAQFKDIGVASYYSIPENSQNNDYVGYFHSWVTYNPANPLKYSIQSNHQDAYKINSSTGLIQVNNQQALETSTQDKVHIVLIRIEDGKYFDVDTAFIRIKDNDHCIFIDPSRSSNGNGSYNSPYNTWSGVTIKGGYGYFQKRGTKFGDQTIRVYQDGTEQNPTVLSAYGQGNRPILDGSNHHYHYVSAIAIGDKVDKFIDFVQIYNYDFYNWGGNGILSFYYNTHIETNNCLFRNNGQFDNPNDGGKKGPGLYYYGDKVSQKPQYNYTRNCVSHHNTEHGFKYENSQKSFIINCHAHDNGKGGSGHGFQLGYTENSYYKGLKAHNNRHSGIATRCRYSHLEDIIAYGNEHGIKVWNHGKDFGHDLTIKKAILYNNRNDPSKSGGIYTLEDVNNIVFDSIVSYGNIFGMNIRGENKNITITRSSIYDNTSTGISFSSYSYAGYDKGHENININFCHIQRNNKGIEEEGNYKINGITIDHTNFNDNTQFDMTMHSNVLNARVRNVHYENLTGNFEAVSNYDLDNGNPYSDDEYNFHDHAISKQQGTNLGYTKDIRGWKIGDTISIGAYIHGADPTAHAIDPPVFPDPLPDSIFAITDDATLRFGSNSNNNYGSSGTNIIKTIAPGEPDSTYHSRIILKFDLQNLELHRDSIEKAELFMYLSDPSNSEHSLYQTSNDWDENTVTANNAPKLGAHITTNTVRDSTQWHGFNITKYVFDQLLTKSEISIYAESNNSDYARYNSNNSSSIELRPYIKISKGVYVEPPIDSTEAPKDTTQSPTDTTTVTDPVDQVENRSPKIDNQELYAKISENATHGDIDLIKATDPDNDELSFRILRDDHSMFTINSKTGLLSFDSELPIDPLAKNKYYITVSVTDNSDKPKSDEAIITISFEPNYKVYFIDPQTKSTSRDGSLAKPFKSWSEVSWEEGAYYAQKSGTIAQEGKILVTANNVTLQSYGEGERPRIESSATDYAFKFYDKQGTTLKNLEINAESAIAGIYFMGSECKDNLVSNCVFNASQYGIRLIEGDGFEIEYSSFDNPVNGVYTFADETNIKYSIFKNSELAINIASLNSSAEIFNNVFFSNKSGVSSSYSELIVYNNIFYLEYPGDNAINHNLDKLVSDNNIFYPDQEGFVKIAERSYVDLEDLQSNEQLDLNSLTDDPQFVDVYYENFSITEQSPAIDAGKNVGIFKDIMGIDVPYGSAPDIGAVELKSAQAPSRNEELEEAFGDFRLYPNPTRDFITISVDNTIVNVNKLTVLSVTGRTIISENLPLSESNELMIDMSQESPGIYVAVVYTPTQIYSKQFMVQR